MPRSAVASASSQRAPRSSKIAIAASRPLTAASNLPGVLVDASPLRRRHGDAELVADASCQLLRLGDQRQRLVIVVLLRAVDRQRRQRTDLRPAVVGLVRDRERPAPDLPGRRVLLARPRHPPLEQQRSRDRPRFAQRLGRLDGPCEERLGHVEVGVHVDRDVPAEPERQRERPVVAAARCPPRSPGRAPRWPPRTRPTSTAPRRCPANARASRTPHPSSGPASASARRYRSNAERLSIRRRARSAAASSASTARSAARRSPGSRSSGAIAAASR